MHQHLSNIDTCSRSRSVTVVGVAAGVGVGFDVVDSGGAPAVDCVGVVCDVCLLFAGGC